MKKLFKFIFSFVIGIIIFALLASAVTLFIIYDKDDINNNDIKDNPKSSLVIINNSLQEGSEDSTTTDEVSLLLDVIDLNYLFYNLAEQIVIKDPNIKITGVSVGVKESAYYLKMSVSAYSFPTVFIAGIDFIDTDSGFAIKLNDLNVGKLSVSKLTNLFIKKVDESEIEKTLESKNIYCDLDLANYTITFSKQEIKKLLSDSLNESTEAPLINLLADLFIDNEELLTFNLGDNDMFGVILHLKDIKLNETIKYDYSLEDIEYKCQKLLNENKILTSEVNIVFNYLVNGYDSLQDEAKQVIDNIDFSSVSIMDNKAYKGIIKLKKYTINEYLLDSISSTDAELLVLLILSNKLDIAISEDILNLSLTSLNFLGKCYGFAHDVSNEVSYMAIKHFLIDLKEDEIDMKLVIDINDVDVFLEIDLLAKDTSGLNISCDLNYVKLGNITLNKEQEKDLLKYLKEFSGSVDFLEVDPENNQISFNFALAISSNSTLNSFIEKAMALGLDINTQIKVLEEQIVISYKI